MEVKDEDEDGKRRAGRSEKRKEGRSRKESNGNWRRYGSRCNENIVQRILKSRVLGTTKRSCRTRMFPVKFASRHEYRFLPERNFFARTEGNIKAAG